MLKCLRHTAALFHGLIRLQLTFANIQRQRALFTLIRLLCDINLKKLHFAQSDAVLQLQAVKFESFQILFEIKICVEVNILILDEISSLFRLSVMLLAINFDLGRINGKVLASSFSTMQIVDSLTPELTLYHSSKFSSDNIVLLS